jgi:hypothetical protein
MANFTINADTERVAQYFRIAPQKLAEALHDAGWELANDAEGYFKQTVSTWNHKPVFGKEVKVTGSSFTADIGTSDRIYMFISGGTRVRRALLSRDWVSKTQPGRLQAGPGRGRVIRISKKINEPGIKARKFDEQIKKILDPTVLNVMAGHIKRWIG